MKYTLKKKEGFSACELLARVLMGKSGPPLNWGGPPTLTENWYNST